MALGNDMSFPLYPPWKALCKSFLGPISEMFNGLGPGVLGHHIVRCSAFLACSAGAIRSCYPPDPNSEHKLLETYHPCPNLNK
jgi:hypothetical protein